MFQHLVKKSKQVIARRHNGCHVQSLGVPLVSSQFCIQTAAVGAGHGSGLQVIVPGENAPLRQLLGAAGDGWRWLEMAGAFMFWLILNPSPKLKPWGLWDEKCPNLMLHEITEVSNVASKSMQESSFCNDGPKSELMYINYIVLLPFLLARLFAASLLSDRNWEVFVFEFVIICNNVYTTNLRRSGRPRWFPLFWPFVSICATAGQGSCRGGVARSTLSRTTGEWQNLILRLSDLDKSV